MEQKNQAGKKHLDIVTLIRYTTGTVKNCESGRFPRRRGPISFGLGEGTMARRLVVRGGSHRLKKLLSAASPRRNRPNSCPCSRTHARSRGGEAGRRFEPLYL